MKFSSFTIRDLLWGVLALSMLFAWWQSQSKLAASRLEIRQVQMERAYYKEQFLLNEYEKERHKERMARFAKERAERRAERRAVESALTE